MAAASRATVFIVDVMTPRFPGSSLLQPEFDFTRLPAAASPLVAVPPTSECELSVAIPVHNEETDIQGTLMALAAQVDLNGKDLDRVRYEVLVLANNCTDRTGEIVREFAARHPSMRLHLIEIVLLDPHAHVGAARRLVMDEACRRLEGLGRRRGVIAATDGDTRVRPRWVAANLAEVAAGADAVGGRILAEPTQIAALLPGTRLYYRLDTTYRTLRAAYETILNPGPGNPWPRHHHCFGASLAVTAETYRAAGGLPVIRCLEDMAFTDALDRLDARVRQSPAVNVSTSLRVSGRVDVGLSSMLTKWTLAAESGEPLMLTSPDAIAREALNRRYVREHWQRHPPTNLLRRAAAQVGVTETWLGEHWRRAGGAGELCQMICWHQRDLGTGPYALPLMEVRAAIAELRRRIAERREELRMATVTYARKDRAGTFLRGDPSDAAADLRWLRQRFHEPDRRSADNLGQRDSSAPATNDLPVTIG